ncbi:hypothetical protein FLO80_12055 [Aquicoccus porphyridii]|uniref:D-galactarate dehydratase n=1 Tax=Aquicoccus porphyridii TaxID=1852029 RepID=A0A5A9ZC01_9RHOB|nr:hypothetical protein [Aquicoccus porphyridii]KAA0914727.1 hypothetical protein FLO80_12055 [Aquicoccus porphyridii]RAI53343.1 hypothetical protein DOO74_13605 [Rhodobacteraceae bacterium AsT-22]
MKQRFVSVGVAVFLAGCGEIMPMEQGVAPDGGGEPQVRPVARPGEADAAVRPSMRTRTVEEFDTTSAEERQAAERAGQTAQAGGQGRSLGRTIASLGDPARPGLWIETPLVSAAGQGRVIFPSNGKAVELDLIPIDAPRGAGSRMSLAAFRVIEAPLTDLPEVEVYSE